MRCRLEYDRQYWIGEEPVTTLIDTTFGKMSYTWAWLRIYSEDAPTFEEYWEENKEKYL